VSIGDSYGFKWSGNLAVNESRAFYVEFKGPIKDKIFNKVRADGYTEEGYHVWSTDVWTLTTIVSESYDLIDAINKDIVDVEFRGTGYCAGDVIKLRITPKLEITVNIEITPGLVLINSGLGQNMIIAESRTITVKPGIELDLNIEAYCLDLHKDNPSSSESFSLRTDPGTYGEDVIKLMMSLTDAPRTQKPVAAVQIALWVITDDISIGEISISFSLEDIRAAKWLLENAGIDISRKRLFQEAPGT